MLLTTHRLYCVPTRTYAIIEQEMGYCAPEYGNIVAAGKIEPRGNAWVFSGSGSPVCTGFCDRGPTLYGSTAPESTATRVYQTERGFDASCRRLTGETVASAARSDAEMMAIGFAVTSDEGDKLTVL